MDGNILGLIIELQHCKPLMTSILLLRICGIIPNSQEARYRVFVLLSSAYIWHHHPKGKGYPAISNRGKFQPSARKILRSCYIPVLGDLPPFLLWDEGEVILGVGNPKVSLFFSQILFGLPSPRAAWSCLGTALCVNLNSSSTERGCWTSPQDHCPQHGKRLRAVGAELWTSGLTNSLPSRGCAPWTCLFTFAPERSKAPWKGRVGPESDFL